MSISANQAYLEGSLETAIAVISILQDWQRDDGSIRAEALDEIKSLEHQFFTAIKNKDYEGATNVAM